MLVTVMALTSIRDMYDTSFFDGVSCLLVTANPRKTNSQINECTHSHHKNQIRKAATDNPISINSISSYPRDLSHLSHLSQTSQQSTINLTRELVEEFFYDDGRPYRQPIPHTLDKSPCKSIIGITRDNFYYCTMHPDIQNIYLESVEHHIKYKDAEPHKLEILKFLESVNHIQIHD